MDVGPIRVCGLRIRHLPDYPINPIWLDRFYNFNYAISQPKSRHVNYNKTQTPNLHQFSPAIIPVHKSAAGRLNFCPNRPALSSNYLYAIFCYWCKAKSFYAYWEVLFTASYNYLPKLVPSLFFSCLVKIFPSTDYYTARIICAFSFYRFFLVKSHSSAFSFFPWPFFQLWVFYYKIDLPNPIVVIYIRDGT